MSTPVVTNWQTDIIDNRDPDYVYEFPLEGQVANKLRSQRIQLFDHATGESEIFDIPGWQVCHRDTGPETLAGFAPSEGKPLDTVLRHGNGSVQHVAMRIHRKHWEVLQRAQEQRADAYQQRVDKGGRYEFDANGATTGTTGDLTPGNIRLTQKPIARV